MTEIESMLEFTIRSCVPADPRIQKRLMDFAHEEVEHIRMLADLIARDGGEVVLDKPRLTPSTNLEEFFSLSAAREDNSIKRYRALLELLDSPADKSALGQTVEQEEAHRKLLEEARAYCRQVREK
jgi:rubrerythrin